MLITPLLFENGDINITEYISRRIHWHNCSPLILRSGYATTLPFPLEVDVDVDADADE